MEKFKKFVNEHKVFFTILLVAISLLGLEYVIVNNYVDKKTNPKKNKSSNITSNINDLNDKQKSLIGINSNTNDESNKSSITTDTIIENEKDKKKDELLNSNLNKDYIDYEKLSDEEKAKIDVIPSKDKIDIDNLDKIDDKNTKSIPTKFNLADKININFEDQGSYGLCWNFATTKVFETYLALNYNKQYNFSEIAVDYLSSPYLYNIGFMLHGGGNFDIYNSVINKIGGLIESKNLNSDYYHEYTEEEYKNMLTLPRVAISNYEVVRFPTLYASDNKMYDSSENEITSSDLEKYRDVIKKHIMTNSAVYFTINSDSKASYATSGNLKPSTDYLNLVKDGQRTFFCKNDDCYWRSGAHAMALIGWDDNFDRRLFLQIDQNGKEYYPEKNGAFIIANSWSDKKEYYYISYEDTELYSDMIGIKKIDTSDMSKYLNITNFNEGIKDSLKNYVLNINGQDYIKYENLDQVEYLDLSDSNLTNNDLINLKYFKNIKYLDISNNNITDISSLSTFINLIDLDISNNNITDISVLSNMTKLSYLYLNDNNISDITPIKNLNKLNYLVVNNNHLVNYEDVFNNLNELFLLSLDNCNIGDIILGNGVYMSLNLSNNPNLNLKSKVDVSILELNNNSLTSLDILSNINTSNLQNISLVNNDIKDISYLTNYELLNTINLSGNKNISNIEKVKDIYGEKEKNKSNSGDAENVVTSFFGGILTSVKKLDEEHIDIEDTELQDAQSEMYPSEKELILDDCNISDIKVFNNLNLSVLSLSKNNITSVDDFENNNIEVLYLSNNPINDLDLGKLLSDNILELYLSNVGLKELKSKNKITIEELPALDLSNNDITDISVLNDIKIINFLSLDSNTNFKDYNLKNEVNYLNLSNTSIDDTIIDKIDYENIYVLNLSSNKNIKDVNKLVTDIENKCKKVEEELNAKKNEETDEESVFDTSVYIGLILDDSILNVSLYSDYLITDSNYVIHLDKEADGSVNLLKGDNFNLFRKFTNSWDLKLNDMTVSKDLTKMNINENSYITMDSMFTLDKTYTIKFN